MTQSVDPEQTKGLFEVSLELPKEWTQIGSGKVRALYLHKEKEYLLSVTTDRISAFDVVLPQPIPYKGAVLNLLNAHFLEQAQQIVPQWMISCPAPQLMIGRYAEPLPVECIIRGHLSGHAWRIYKKGERMLFGTRLPEGLFEHAPLLHPIFTPSTKAKQGASDEYLSPEDLLEQTNLSLSQLQAIKAYAERLFAEGTSYAAHRGLRLMDAKYEFGLYRDTIYLIDELHTPDAARYCSEKDYQNYLEAHQRGQNLRLEQRSKEALRTYLLDRGQAGQAPTLSSEEIQQLSMLYTHIFEELIGHRFTTKRYSTNPTRLQEQALQAIKALDT